MADELAEVTKKFGSLSEYSIQLNRWFLKPIGAWPESSSTTRHEKILSQISIIICWCISLFTIIPALLRLILEKEDLYLKLKAFGPLSHWIVGVFNYAALLLRKDEIRRCIEHIQADWEIITRITDQRIMLKNAKIGRSIAAFTAAFVHSGIVSTCIVLGALKHTTKVGNETISIYRLPCPPYKIQTDTNPTYGIILGSQFLSGFIVTSSALGAFSVATVVTSHALGQLNVVTNWINEFVNQSDKERDSHTHKISVIVDHHLRILNLVEHIEHMMSGICFMETFKCMLGMCMPSYYMLAEWSEHNIQNLVTYALVAVSMTFNIFLVCYIGELLSEQCKKVGDIVYMTNWYQLPDKEILNLVMIISRSSMEIKITAGKLITLSVYTFAESWDQDWMYSVQINRWLLKSVGIWPRALCLSTMEKMNSIILVLISCFLIGFLLIPCALCTLLDKTGDLDTKIKMIGPLSFCVMAAIKYYILVSRGDMIGKCIENIRNDWIRLCSQQRQGERDLMKESARIGRSLAILCAGFMYSGGFFYTTVMPLCSKRTVIIDNETVRAQAFPIYRGLLDPRTSPSFEIVQLMQCLAGFVIYSVTISACSLAAVFVMHACGQFKILISKLDKLIDGKTEEKDTSTYEQRLGDIVEHHLHILRSIAESAYMINWYLLPDKKALGLILMFVISNSSLKLTAGKLVELSLASFCSVNNTHLSTHSLP
ncbi:hypothetical protein WN48_04719 [Eufriesea mexicana]|nr:hypothetical protein WN48_04719 [Eufriesea mexicana]